MLSEWFWNSKMIISFLLGWGGGGGAHFGCHLFSSYNVPKTLFYHSLFFFILLLVSLLSYIKWKLTTLNLKNFPVSLWRSASVLCVCLVVQKIHIFLFAFRFCKYKNMTWFYQKVKRYPVLGIVVETLVKKLGCISRKGGIYRAFSSKISNDRIRKWIHTSPNEMYS